MEDRDFVFFQRCDTGWILYVYENQKTTERGTFKTLDALMDFIREEHGSDLDFCATI